MMPDAVARGVALFNAGAYRDALLSFEVEWAQNRHESLRALILTANALNQLHLGLMSGPQRNIATALRLLSEAEQYHTIDLAHLHMDIQSLAYLLESGILPTPIPAVQLRFVYEEPALVPIGTQGEPAMYDQEDAAISALLNDGLDTAEPDEILARLDAELAAQTDEMSATLSADAPGWLAGTGSAARRFISFYADAIREEICEQDRSGLNDRYKSILGGMTIQDQVRSLIPAVLTVLGIGSSFINPLVIASLVAVWLVRVGADRWCRLPVAVEQQPAAQE